MKGKMEMLNFFNVKNTWDITWAHAVNDKVRLKRFCSDATMMIEGDISLSSDGNIIMAHPPSKKSDLDFEEWINTISTSHKGAKLDFKDPTVVKPVLKKLVKLKNDIPIFLNADVLRGPGGGEPIFDPHSFISLCNEYYPEASYISLGWTVGYSLKGEYTSEMVDEMLKISKESHVPVTVSALVYYLPRSWNFMRKIFDEPEETITIWNLRKFRVSERLKKWVRNNMDRNKTFVDLIDKEGAPIKV